MSTQELTPEAQGIESDLAPDNVFAMLVHVANTSDVEMGITIHVHGQMITGRLISGATFWDECAADLREGGNGPQELIEAMAESMEQVAEQYRQTYVENGMGADESSTAAFLHLRNAHTLGPQGPTPTDGALWRGRLASIDGFTFGELRGMS
jgi:hypothetical protein